MANIKSLTGMQDLYDDGDMKNLSSKLFEVEKRIKDIFINYKFQEIRTPVLEDANLFIRSVGSSSDIVNKEIYSFNDRNDKALAMRPEGTASVIRSIIESNNQNIEIKHINNRTNSETCSTLLKYDSIHGKFEADINFDDKHLIINKNNITFSQETDLNNINWKKHDVDYVFECTGKFNSKDKLKPHLNNGAKKVLVSAPCKNADKTVVFGVNESELKKDNKIISAASCTTNCLAPVAHVLHENFQIEKGFMTTIHAFTSDQRILDNSHKDPRRARSASQSIVPTSTGASKAISEIIPSLKGKLEGVAMRVPTPNVSLVELVFCTNKDLSIEKINSAFENFSKKNKILEITKEKLVSIDFNHNPASSIVDASLTNVVGKNMGKISAWYDNEWGFSNRMCDIAEYLHKIS